MSRTASEGVPSQTDELRRWRRVTDRHTAAAARRLHRLAGGGPGDDAKWADADATGAAEAPALRVDGRPREAAGLPEVVASLGGDRVLSKVVSAAGAMCQEMRFLVEEAENRFYWPLLLYGAGVDGAEVGSKQTALSHILPLLIQMSDYHKQCQTVIRHVMQQLSSIHFDKKNPGASVKLISAQLSSLSDCNFQVIFDHLGQLLTAMITLDALLMQQQRDSNSSLGSDFAFYRVTVSSALVDSSRYGISGEGLRELDATLDEVDNRLFKTQFFSGCIDQDFDDGDVAVTSNPSLREAALVALRAMLAVVEAGRAEANLWDYGQKLKVVDLTASVLFFGKTFGVKSRKLLDRVWSLFKTFHCVTLVGNVLWYPEHLFSAHWPDYYAGEVSEKARKAVPAARRVALDNMTRGLHVFVAEYRKKVLSWMNKLETFLRQCQARRELRRDEQTERSALLRGAALVKQGLRLARELNEVAEDILNLHVKQAREFHPCNAISMCRLVEQLKSIEQTFNRLSLLASDAVVSIRQIAILDILVITQKAKIVGSRGRGGVIQSSVDAHAALCMVQELLAGPFTPDRFALVRVCMSIATQKRIFLSNDEVREISENLRLAYVLSDFQRLVRSACDCSFLFWHRDDVVFPYFTHLIEVARVEATRLPLFFAALTDCGRALCAAKHFEDDGSLVGVFVRAVKREFESRFLKPLCLDVCLEVRSRVLTYLERPSSTLSAAAASAVATFKDFAPVNSNGRFDDPHNRELLLLLDLRLRLFDEVVSVKAHVESYLRRTFYDLTALSPDNAHNYRSMRHVARAQFGLDVGDDLLDVLPEGSDRNDVSVLETWSDLDGFFDRHKYSTWHQAFLPNENGDSTCKRFGTDEVAKAIKIHGYGIVEAAIDPVLKFLCEKWTSLCAIVRREEVSSLLQREHTFRQGCGRLSQNDHTGRLLKLKEALQGLRVEENCNDTKKATNFAKEISQLVLYMGCAHLYLEILRAGQNNFKSSKFSSPGDSLEKQIQGSIDGEEASRSKLTAALLLRPDEKLQSPPVVSIFAQQLTGDPDASARFRHFHLALMALYLAEVGKSMRTTTTTKNQGGSFPAFDAGVKYVMTTLGQWDDYTKHTFSLP